MIIQELKSEEFYKEFQINISFSKIEKEVDEKIHEIAKNFKMPGFREGKVPISIVKQKVKKRELSNSIQENISLSIEELIKSKDIIVYLKPSVQIMSFDENDGLIFKVAFETLPKIPEIKFNDLEVEEISLTVEDNEIRKAKNILFKEFRKFVKATPEHKVQVGDKVKINFYGQIDGNDFDGNSGESMELVVGDNSFLSEFEYNLRGYQLNEEKSFDIVFPDDYPQKDIAGKKAIFRVKVTEIEQLSDIREITDEMLKKVGLESESQLDELIIGKITSSFNNAIRLKMKKDLFSQIDHKYDFKLPDKILKQDFDSILSNFQKSKDRQPSIVDNKSEEEIESELRSISRRRVKLGLIISDLIKRYDISVTDDELNQIINAQSKQNTEKEKILEFYKDPNNVEKIRGVLLEEKALDFMLSQVKTTTLSMTTTDFAKEVIPNLNT